VEDDFGENGTVNVRVEEVVSGLDVPWGIAFLPNNDMLVTERPGRVRLVQNGQLQPQPVATLSVTARGGEGGLLGIALHPEFASNRFFYLYYTTDQGGTSVNRVERWRLSQDGQTAERNRIILDDIPVAAFHNGGRLRFGPDGMLYIGTGDAREPGTSQDAESLAGKILRVTPDGEVPPDNPTPDNLAFISGIRNTQGFDWLDQNTLLVTDHGPSGELGRTGRDEVTVARAGDNLGWPTIYGCQTQAGLVTPSISWVTAVPPGGAAIYTSNTIPEWQGSLIIGTLGSRHLHRVVLDPNNPGQVQLNEVYLQGEYGRLREVIMSPDGELYVTTSNCDARGECPSERDKILRITR
jgi:glucose/arabinose dehydrogenase